MPKCSLTKADALIRNMIMIHKEPDVITITVGYGGPVGQVAGVNGFCLFIDV